MSRAAITAALAAALAFSAACGGGSGSSEETEPPVHVTLPFELHAQETLRLLRGESARLTVAVTGVDEADWPVTVTLEPLPTGVSAEPIHLQATRRSGELHLVALESASAGSHQVDVVARGDAGRHGSMPSSRRTSPRKSPT